MFQKTEFYKKWSKDQNKAVQYLLSELTQNCIEFDTIVSILKSEKIFLNHSHHKNVIEQPYLPAKLRNEFVFLYSLQEKFSEERKKADKVLAYFSFDELIMEMSMLYDYVRIEQSIPIGYESNLLQNINLILNQKLYLLEKEGKQPKPKHQSLDSLHKYFFEIGGWLSQNNVLGWEIYQVYRFYEKFACFQGILDRYCYQENFELSFFDDKTANFKTIDSTFYENWLKNGLKYPLSNNYHSILGMPLKTGYFDEMIDDIEKLPIDDSNKQTLIMALCNLYEFKEAGFDDLVVYENHKHEKQEFSSLLFFQVMNSLAGWSNDRWNKHIEKLRGINIPVMEKIMQVMFSTMREGKFISPLFLRTYNEFLAQIQGTFKGKLDEKEIKAIVDFLLNNLNITSQKLDKINLFIKPFIKLGDFVYSFCGLFGNTNFSIMLENGIFENDKQNTSYTKDYETEEATGKERKHFKDRRSKNIEDKVVRLFEAQRDNFSVCHSHKFRKADQNNKILLQGETDCYAYDKKGNKLFVIQVKSTYTRYTQHQIHEHKTAIQEAKEQLDKDIRYLRDFEGFTEIKQTLGIQQDSFEDLHIVPLIVTTNFEYDEATFEIQGFKGYKISILELEIILWNTKHLLFEPREIILKHYGMIPSEFAVFDGKEEKNRENIINAWNRLEEIMRILIEKDKINLRQANECNANDLLETIENRKVWDMLPTKVELRMSSLAIGDLTLNFVQ